jgi:hypothetical protein
MKMKQMAMIAVLALGTATLAKAQAAPVKDDLFGGTEVFSKGASDVTEITMDPDTLDLVGGKDHARAHNMILNVVRTYTYEKPGMYRPEDVETFRNKLSTGDWRCSVHTREMKSGSSTDVCNKHRTDGLEESAIITVSPKSLTFIHTIRKRGEGEHGGLDALYVSGMPMLATLRPEIMMNIDAAMRGVDTAEMQARMSAGMNDFKIDSEQMKKQMEEVHERMKNLNINSDQMRKQMDEAREKMKDFKFEFKDGSEPLTPIAPLQPKDNSKQPE